VGQIIVAPQNWPFIVALGVMLGLALLEMAILLLGGSLFGFVDDLLPDSLDGDADIAVGVELHAPGASSSLLEQVLGWFAIGRVPFLVVVTALLTSFGLIGLMMQTLLQHAIGTALPASLAAIPALVGASFTTRWLALRIARIIPREETSAVSRDSFIGRIATITLGSARRGEPTQARLTDSHGQTHYIMVEPDRATDVLGEGERILLVARTSAVFRGIRAESEALIDR
jgi:YqiJ-like protein